MTATIRIVPVSTMLTRQKSVDAACVCVFYRSIPNQLAFSWWLAITDVNGHPFVGNSFPDSLTLGVERFRTFRKATTVTECSPMHLTVPLLLVLSTNVGGESQQHPNHQPHRTWNAANCYLVPQVPQQVLEKSNPHVNEWI